MVKKFQKSALGAVLQGEFKNFTFAVYDFWQKFLFFCG